MVLNNLFNKKAIKNIRFLVGMFFVTLFVFASCTPPSSSPSNQTPAVVYLEAKNGVPDEFIGTWNGSYPGEAYTITKNKIVDAYEMELVVISEDFVVTEEGWTLVFVQVPEGKGTQWTPDGNLYAAAFKANGEKLDICMQLDYASVYKTLDAIKADYTTDYKLGTNIYSTCTKEDPNAAPSVTLTDSKLCMAQVKFEKNKVTLLMLKSSGWEEYTSFVPTRDKSKENVNVTLYLYDATQRNYSGDMHYAKIEDSQIYWYEYNDDDGGNDSLIDMCNDYMPEVFTEDFAKISALYE